MEKSFQKLNKLYEVIQTRGTSTPSILEDLAQFIRLDLGIILDEMADYQNYVAHLEQKIREYENNAPI